MFAQLRVLNRVTEILSIFGGAKRMCDLFRLLLVWRP